MCKCIYINRLVPKEQAPIDLRLDGVVGQMFYQLLFMLTESIFHQLQLNFHMVIRHITR